MQDGLANLDGRAVVVAGGRAHDIEAASDGRLGPDPMAALAEPELLAELVSAAVASGGGAEIDPTRLGPPVPRPRKVFAIGLNYRAHADEGSLEVPDNPLVFTKFPSCLVGPDATIELRSDAVDYEGELVVVVGRAGKDIDADDAWEHVAGLTVGQDVSDRAVQFASAPPHFDLGKSFDTFGPIGPVVVSPDSVDRDRLRIVTEVNGEVRQDATTAEMIFDVATLISYLSRVTTLTTGDLVFTGTPDGIGAARGAFLRDGDVVTTRIDGIGTLTNRCVRSTDHHVL